MARVPRGKEVIWTVQEGSADAASAWSHKGAMLRKDAAKTAAQKDGRIVSATGIAGLTDRTHTIIFDLNASEGIKVQGKILDLIVVKHDQKTQMSHGITLSYSGYTFIGEWNDDKDGEGAFIERAAG